MTTFCGFNLSLRYFTGIQDKIISQLFIISTKYRFLSSNCHYKMLDVPKTASQDEIKKAFFEKSKKYHPDVSPGNPSHHKLFVKLNNAYSVLSSIPKRKDYDRSLIKKTMTPVYNNYESYENINKYDHTFYNRTTSRATNNYNESAEHRSKNITVAVAVLAYMFVGATLCFLTIWYKHRQYKTQLDVNSMEASKLYREARERSSKNGLKKQLEILVERQKKSVTKPARED